MVTRSVERAAVAERDLMDALEPVAERLVERHYETCKPWYPHEFVPWSLGRDFPDRDEWIADNVVPMPDELRSALFVNLLTEDNLPYYFHTLDRLFGRSGVWREWSHRWVAEEARHAQALRDFAMVSRALDPWELEDARMSQMSGGQVPDPPGPIDGFVYVSLQELATRIAHRNTGKTLSREMGDNEIGKIGEQLINRVATDENFHFLFYRDLTTSALEIDASVVLPAIERQVRDFAMPGTGIPGFRKHAEAIARAEIYNLGQHHQQILEPVVLKSWKIESLQNLTAEAEQAREAVIRQIARIGTMARRLADRAREAAEKAKALLNDRIAGT